MFGKLKEKLKGALGLFSKKVEEALVDEDVSDAQETSFPSEAEDIVEEKPKVEKKKPEPVKEKPKSKPVPKKESKKEEPKSKVEKKEDVKEPEPVKEKTKPVKKEVKTEKPSPKKDIDSEAKKEQAIHTEAKDLKEEIELEKEKAKVEEIDEPTIKEEAIEEIEHEEKELEKDIQAQEEIIAKEEPKKKGFFGNLFKKKEEVKEVETLKQEEEKTSVSPKSEARSSEATGAQKTPFSSEDKEVTEKKSIFSKVSDAITKKKISESKFEELFQELEIILLENNTSFEVVEKIKADLAKDIVDKPLPRNEINDIILSSLKTSIESLFDVEPLDLLQESENKKPLVISFIGVNGSGKTTQLAKVAKYFQNNGKSVVMAAGDTFRAAAIQQLEEHANNLGIKLIKHDYGADAAAVAYDAIEHAKSKGIDVVLIDTAGRLHSNSNLMEELRKVIRVAKPDLNIFVGESITGNDCIYQATEFSEMVDIHGIILTKADVDEKGGTAISISYVTNKPIMFLGNGQGYEDLEVFDKEKLIKTLGL